MAKSDKKWGYDEAVREIVGSGALSEEDQKILVESILSSNEMDELDIDKILTKMVDKLGFTRTALKKYLRTEIKKQTEGDDETATHAEIAEDYIAEKIPKFSVGSEGDLWFYEETGIFEKKDLREIEVEIGNGYSSTTCKTGGHYREIARQIYIRKVEDGFFEKAPSGVAAKSKFYRLDMDQGEIIEEEYNYDHRCRWTLPFDPAEPNTPSPLFRAYLDHTFDGDPDQENLLQEICGGIITGSFADLQMAVLFKGEGENGKSVIIDMLTSFIPAELRTSVRPDKFRDDKMAGELAGKLLNAVGELDKDAPLDASFKDIVAADTPMLARPIWKPPFMFTPRCAHLFSSQFFPVTKDFSHGFFRRWVILVFKKPVPKKKIKRLGQKIVREEGPQVLRWMLEGAKYLLNNDDGQLSLTDQHHKAMRNWKSSRDSVYAFFNDEEELKIIDSDIYRIPHKDCFRKYCDWCRGEVRKSVGYRAFMDRARIIVQADFRTPEDRRRSFRGISFLSANEPLF